MVTISDSGQTDERTGQPKITLPSYKWLSSYLYFLFNSLLSHEWQTEGYQRGPGRPQQILTSMSVLLSVGP